MLDRLVAMYNATPPPQVAIALHSNASQNTRYGGVMAIHRINDNRSLLLASLLWGRLSLALPQLKNRGAQADKGEWVNSDLAFTRWAHKKGTVGVILELGFLTCPGDVEALTDPATPTKVARAVLEAVSAFGVKT